MRIKFYTETGAGTPERLITGAKILFNEGFLAGLELEGFRVWRGKTGEPYVTFPSRPTGFGETRRYWDLLRSTTGETSPVHSLKDLILEEFRATFKNNAQAQ